MGFKLWNPGELLASADVNAYLMKQTIISCTSGSRPASPVDGMFIYETDSRLFRSWNSSVSAWIVMGNNGPLSWTPTLTATTTNPTMGSGAIRQGQYTRGPGGMVHASFYIKFGSTGAAAGSGQYLISLPVNAQTVFGTSAPEWWGVGRITDNGTFTYNASFYIPGSNLAVISAVANGGVADNSTPMVWTNLDDITGTISYRAANGS